MLRNIKTKVLWKGEAVNGIRHPKNIERIWSISELASIGLEVVPIKNKAMTEENPLERPLNAVDMSFEEIDAAGLQSLEIV